MMDSIDRTIIQIIFAIFGIFVFLLIIDVSNLKRNVKDCIVRCDVAGERTDELWIEVFN